MASRPAFAVKRKLLLRRNRGSNAVAIALVLACLCGIFCLQQLLSIDDETSLDTPTHIMGAALVVTASPPTAEAANALDMSSPRPGENFISFDAYLDCLERRLGVDRRTQREHPFTDWERTVPYLVMPVTVEQGDMKALMCNMTVPIRHLTYVQNGGVGSMTAFLDGVAAAFAFTSRLRVVRMPHNFGYSVALNVAMRHALSLPFEEVPFFMMGNNDVRFPVGMLEAGLPVMYERSLAGRARVAELEAEVATEPNEHTPERFRDVPLRSTDDRHILVTSRLLPDRIRYQPKEERRLAFRDYYGQLYVDESDQTAFWGLTRLAMEVTGFFDENFYPAYYEDVDYVKRLDLLGFQRHHGAARVPGFVHLGNGATLAVARQLHAEHSRGDVLPFVRAATAVIQALFYLKYGADKYGSTEREVMIVTHAPYRDEGFPLDAFFVNERRRRVLTRLQRGGVVYFTEHPEGRSLKERINLMEFLPVEERASAMADLMHRFNRSTAYTEGSALRRLESARE